MAPRATLAGALLLLTTAGDLRAASPVSSSPAADWAGVGRSLFFDPGLSASGRQSCASCHDPAHAYGPPNARAVQLGGADLRTPGVRAVPSLRYALTRTPRWFASLPADARDRGIESDHAPAGGLGWDGRFDTPRAQARFPLLAANEMGNASVAAVAASLRRAPYFARLRALAGANAADDEALFDAAMRALERFELDDPSFAPYSSRYDRFLEGRLPLSAAERRGLKLFNDPMGGNCSVCHRSEPRGDGAHPLFTDFGFHALGVPRNPEIPANADPAYFDLGLCGPLRRDQRSRQHYCGQFRTPTLRNVATRGALFHNGRVHDLRAALRFYLERDSEPQRWYPSRQGLLLIYDDLPAALRINVDVSDRPLDRRRGQPPVWNEANLDDVVAFLRTLTDEDVQPLAATAR